VLERHGKKIGFVGYYFQADPDMLEPEEVYATAKTAGVAGLLQGSRMRAPADRRGRSPSHADGGHRDPVLPLGQGRFVRGA
jgi:hypothetical protein